MQLWIPMTLQRPVAESKWLIGAEFNPRFAHDVHELQRTQLSALFGRRLGQHVSVWGGYALVSYLHPVRLTEHRAMEQLQIPFHAGAVAMNARIRFEQRFLPGVSKVGQLFRTQLRGAVPVGHRGWALTFFDEAFVTFTAVAPAPHAGFATNRIFAGVSHHVSRSVTFEPGYMLQWVHRAGSAPEHFDHVMFMSFASRK